MQHLFDCFSFGGVQQKHRKNATVESHMHMSGINDFLFLSSEKNLSDSIDQEQIVCRWAERPKTKRIIKV